MSSQWSLHRHDGEALPGSAVAGGRWLRGALALSTPTLAPTRVVFPSLRVPAVLCPAWNS